MIAIDGISSSEWLAQWNSQKNSLAIEKYAKNLYSGGNLVANGFCETGDNFNFSNFSVVRNFMPNGTNAAYKIPTVTASQSLNIHDNQIAINAAKRLEVSFYISAGNLLGGNYTSNRVYIAFDQYDTDSNLINYWNVKQVAGTNTTLALPLNNGDTTITLTSSANFYNNGLWYMSRLKWWPMTSDGIYGYKEATGKINEPYTYSRNHTVNNYGVPDWLSGGISGNVLTLNPSKYPSGWNLGSLQAGTPICNADFSDVAYYIFAAIVPALGHNRYTKILTLNPTVAGDVIIWAGTSKVRLRAICNDGPSSLLTDYTFSNIMMRYL